jgi:hypothetical protein
MQQVFSTHISPKPHSPQFASPQVVEICPHMPEHDGLGTQQTFAVHATPPWHLPQSTICPQSFVNVPQL